MTSKITQHADDQLRSAITNQVTWLDGFSHEKRFRKYLKAKAGQVHAEHLCSNALAMSKNLTDTHIPNCHNNRKLMVMEEEREEDGIKWPEWISASDTVQPDVVVAAADGSGNFKTVSAAVAAAPEKSSKRYIIKIKAGVYRENVVVPSKKTNIMFLGDGSTNTIITASRNVADGSTTFHSATVGTVDFIFGNSAVVLQDCDIHARLPNPGQKNMVTAQGRVDPNQNTGIVIQQSRIGATKDLEPVKTSFPTFLAVGGHGRSTLGL